MAKNNFSRFLAVTSAMAVAASILVLLAATQPVGATFPGTNGRIAFERDPDGPRGPEDPEIYSINVRGENPKRLTDNATEDTGPAFSADGKKIVYSGGGRRAWDSYRADLFVMEADGSDKTRLTKEREIPGAQKADDLQPSFSPSGRRIAFVRRGPGTNSDIYRIRTDGNNPKRLVDIPNFEYRSGGQPAWSPDGTKMVFHRSPDGYESRIYVADADGTDEKPLTTSGAYDSEPAFSPGGGKVIFASDRDGDYDLYVVNADGSGEPRRLTNYPGDERSPDWRPVQ